MPLKSLVIQAAVRQKGGIKKCAFCIVFYVGSNFTKCVFCIVFQMAGQCPLFKHLKIKSLKENTAVFETIRRYEIP